MENAIDEEQVFLTLGPDGRSASFPENVTCKEAECLKSYLDFYVGEAVWPGSYVIADAGGVLPGDAVYAVTEDPEAAQESAKKSEPISSEAIGYRAYKVLSWVNANRHYTTIAHAIGQPCEQVEAALYKRLQQKGDVMHVINGYWRDVPLASQIIWRNPLFINKEELGQSRAVRELEQKIYDLLLRIPGRVASYHGLAQRMIEKPECVRLALVNRALLKNDVIHLGQGIWEAMIRE